MYYRQNIKGLGGIKMPINSCILICLFYPVNHAVDQCSFRFVDGAGSVRGSGPSIFLLLLIYILSLNISSIYINAYLCYINEKTVKSA